ncbi:hypothetical protein SEUCBS139899_004730 [Sporothrix eucalyptigena]
MLFSNDFRKLLEPRASVTIYKCLDGAIVIKNGRYVVTKTSLERARTKYGSSPIVGLEMTLKMVNEFIKCPHGMVVLEMISPNGVNVAYSNSKPATYSYERLLAMKAADGLSFMLSLDPRKDRAVVWEPALQQLSNQVAEICRTGTISPYE